MKISMIIYFLVLSSSLKTYAFGRGIKCFSDEAEPVAIEITALQYKNHKSVIMINSRSSMLEKPQIYNVTDWMLIANEQMITGQLNVPASGGSIKNTVKLFVRFGDEGFDAGESYLIKIVGADNPYQIKVRCWMGSIL